MKILRTTAIAAGLLVLGTGAGLLLSRAASYANTKVEAHLGEGSGAVEPKGPVKDPSFGDWFALGSGCRSRTAEPGDVQVEDLGIFRTDPLKHATRFHMPAYRLSMEGPPQDPQGKEGSRECSIRLAVTPPAGFRIHDVRARTHVVAQRALDAELQVNQELKLGNFSIGASRVIYSRGVGPREIDTDVNLGTDLPNGTRHPETECGAPKLVAYDFTWLAKRGESSEPVRVDLGGDKTLDVEVIFEPCTALEAGAPAQGASK